MNSRQPQESPEKPPQLENAEDRASHCIPNVSSRLTQKKSRPKGDFPIKLQYTYSNYPRKAAQDVKQPRTEQSRKFALGISNRRLLLRGEGES